MTDLLTSGDDVRAVYKAYSDALADIGQLLDTDPVGNPNQTEFVRRALFLLAHPDTDPNLLLGTITRNVGFPFARRVLTVCALDYLGDYLGAGEGLKIDGDTILFDPHHVGRQIGFHLFRSAVTAALVSTQYEGLTPVQAWKVAGIVYGAVSNLGAPEFDRLATLAGGIESSVAGCEVRLTWSGADIASVDLAWLLDDTDLSVPAPTFIATPYDLGDLA